jgi:hypothetical protein
MLELVLNLSFKFIKSPKKKTKKEVKIGLLSFIHPKAFMNVVNLLCVEPSKFGKEDHRVQRRLAMGILPTDAPFPFVIDSCL